MQKYGLRLCGPVLLSALLALPAGAQEPPTVVISEINFAGSAASTADEWLELANTGNSPVDLSGWILAGAATGGEALAIAEGTVLAAHDTLVIANYPRGNEKTTLDVDPELVTSSIALANSNLSLFLTLPDGTIVDQYVDSGAPDFGSTTPTSSIERNLNDLNWQTATVRLGLTDASQLGTPGNATFDPSVEVPPVTVDEPEPETVTPTEPVDEPEETVELPAMCEIPIPADETPAPTVPSEEPDEEPEIPNTPPAPASFNAHDIVINEIYSDAGDGDEWVELLNKKNSAISLTGWSLKDASGKITQLADSISANGFSLVLNPSGSLNNGGDTVTLFDPSGKQIDSVVYGTDSVPLPKRETSASRDSSGDWFLVAPTPKATNIFPQTIPETPVTYDDPQTNEPDTTGDDPETPEGTVDEPDVATPTPADPASCTQRIVATAAPLQAAGDSESSTSNSATSNTPTTKSGETILEGVVVAAPNTFGSQTAFLNGHELYFYKADWPDLTVGSFIRVAGVYSEVDGHQRLKIANIDRFTLLGSKDANPLDLTPGLLDTLPHGTLVRVHGVVSERNGKRLTLVDDNGASLTVYAHDKTQISLGSLAGAELTLTGLVRKTKDGVEIMPRSAADIVQERATAVSNEATLATSAPVANKTPWVGGGLLTGGVGALGTWFLRSRKLSLV